MTMLIMKKKVYLINKDTGEMWKFQWSNESDEDYRWIKKIN